MEGRDLQKITFIVSLLVLGNWIFSMLQGYFTNEGFHQRIRVAFDFTAKLSGKLGMADYEQIENPAYLDWKAMVHTPACFGNLQYLKKL
jgi:hypothetical protein